MIMSHVLFSERLDRPLLKFDSVSTTSVHKRPMTGISLFGPYDKSLIQTKSVKHAIMYPNEHESLIGNFITAYTKGLDRYPGYTRWFRQGIEAFERYPIDKLTLDGYLDVANDVLKRTYDLVFVVTESLERPNPVYESVKTHFLKKGVPSQFISSVRLSGGPNQLQWVLGNVALSVYAKMGGTPWVIEAEDRPEIILGISRAFDRKNNVIVGFAVLFKQNGDFILTRSKAPVSSWDAYEISMEELVYDAINDFRRSEGNPGQVVFHFTKRPGQREIGAIQRAIRRLQLDINYALVHLNESSGIRLFDTSHTSYVPTAGLKVSLSSHEALLLLGGRDPTGYSSLIGTPTVLDVSIDKRSTVKRSDYNRIINQVFNLAFVNWRGFNARTLPVTTNYAYLIAKIIGDLGSADEWREIIDEKNLIDKAWFL